MQLRRTLVPLMVLQLALSLCYGAKEAPAGEKKTSAAPKEFVTHHKIQIGKEVLAYSADAGEILLGRPDEPEASVFSVSYLQEGIASASERPITFLFNGGPGSSAAWLHLGAFGPRRVALSGNPPTLGAPPYRVGDNPYTLLRYSDLVFVDPVGTGYSRALGKKKDADYWGVDADGASIAEFIRTYLTKHHRWNSPKFLAGESYGTIRAAVLIKDLELNLLNGVAFNGVILISTALDARTFVGGGGGNELPYVVNLPTYAATAYYHDALPEKPADLDRFLNEVKEFAGTEYLTALFKGDALPDEEAARIAEKLHRYTGLSVGYIRRSRLRIDDGRFLKELLRDRGETLAKHDTRFVGKDPDDAGDSVEFDPFIYGISGPFVSTTNSYLGGELNVDLTTPYVVFSLEAAQSWKRAGNDDRAFSGYLYTVPYLTEAAATNKDFRIFVASGIHDLATPFYGAEYVFDHSGIDKARLTLKNYEGGHMMYLYDSSLKQLSSDIGSFIKGK